MLNSSLEMPQAAAPELVTPPLLGLMEAAQGLSQGGQSPAGNVLHDTATAPPAR